MNGTPPPLTANEVAARLDRLPISRFHYRFLALISLGAWFDYYDNFVAGTLAVALPRAGVLPTTRPGEWFSAVGLFTATLPLGMFFGSLFLGMASDHLGRRLAFVAMLLLYSLATLAGGAGYYPLAYLLGSGAGLALLFGTRFLAGAGVGAENVIIDAYVSEVVPRQIRGRAIAWTQAAAFTAVPAAALLARLLASQERPQGWTWLLVLGSLGALLSWYFRRRLPESPRWSAAVGRHDEALASLEQIEAAAAADGSRTRQNMDSSSEPAFSQLRLPKEPDETARRLPLRAIWSPAYRGRTLLLVAFHVLQTAGYYGFMHWLPTLLEAKGFGHNEALTMQFGAFLLAPAGPLLAVWLSERWQRKWLLVVLAVIIGGGQWALAELGEPVQLTALAAVLVVGLNWFSATFHAYQAELYPTEARATGIGFTYAWSRASMVMVDVVMPGLIVASLARAFGLMALALLGVAVTVALFGPLTNARTLEDISPGIV
jgi:putative MFS transporter